MSVDTILIIYIRLRRRQSNQSNQNDRKRTENKYPLEQNEYESDNENGCQNLFFDSNKQRHRSHLLQCHGQGQNERGVSQPAPYIHILMP